MDQLSVGDYYDIRRRTNRPGTHPIETENTVYSYLHRFLIQCCLHRHVLHCHCITVGECVQCPVFYSDIRYPDGKHAIQQCRCAECLLQRIETGTTIVSLSAWQWRHKGRGTSAFYQTGYH